jgi:hypothetical protein
MLTGYADPAVITNKAKYNANTNLLQYLNTMDEFRNRVAFFGSWKLFGYILTGEIGKIPLNCGYQPVSGDSLSYAERTVNYIQENSAYHGLPTRTDLLTFTLATEYIRQQHPKVMYIGFGETDEFAHKGEYDNYLSQINQFDKFLAELWSIVQRDDFYKNKTRIFITTDHGRGRKPNKWMKHGAFTGGSEETWLLQLGAGIEVLGEVTFPAQLYNEQFAETIARYLGKSFEAAHPVAERVYYLVK